MNNTLLLSEKILKRDSFVSDNTDDMYILPSIRTAQDQRLQPIIGTVLFEKLKELVNTGDISANANAKYKELLDNYIVVFLEWSTMAEMQIPLNFKMRNAGVVNNVDSQHYSAAYMNDVQYLKSYYEDKAIFYANRLSGYLQANSEIFTEYYDYRDQADMMARQDAYNTHIYLGDGNSTPKVRYSE